MNELRAGIDRIKFRKKSPEPDGIDTALLFAGYARCGFSICITNACPPVFTQEDGRRLDWCC